jgi:hypothetical protein
MPISMYDTRSMLAALREIPAPKTYLRDTFFRNVVTFETVNVDIDIVKGKRRVAAYVSPQAEAHVSDRAGYTTKSYQAPYIKEMRIIKPIDTLQRSFGENVYSSMSPEERSRKILADDLVDMNEMITRSEEIQASQALFSGAITVNNGDTISFGVDATHMLTLASTAKWDDVSFTLSKAMEQFRSWQAGIRADCGLSGDNIIMGSGVVKKLFALIEAAANNPQPAGIILDRGRMAPAPAGINGVSPIAYFPEVGCQVWSYDELYWDGSANQPMVPVNKVCMISSQARMDRLYGVIQDMDGLYAVDRFAKSWVENNPSVRCVEMDSAPLLVPHQVNGFLTAQVY